MTLKEQLDLYMAAYKEAQENAAQSPVTPMKNMLGALGRIPLVRGAVVTGKQVASPVTDVIKENKEQLKREAAVRQFSWKSKQDHRRATSMMNGISAGLSNLAGHSRGRSKPSAEQISAEEAHSRAIAEMYNKRHPVAGK